MQQDTIAALATPPGEGALAIIRLSGPRALTIVDRCFVPGGKLSRMPSAAPSHTIHYGHIVRKGMIADEVLISVLRAPRTFTREDMLEITCHGGMQASKVVLETVLENGARPAEPGEFTRRAFLNGRIDLTQAEAVADVIHSRTELALRAAQEQLAGNLSQRINRLRDALVSILAHVEAHIDFPEEDIEPDTRQKLLARLGSELAFMAELLSTANEGQILRRGIRAAIIGKPNAGKSSLLNQLLGHDRAIVSSLPGTTRDTIEETANIRGIPVVIIDTAGLRQAQDELEEEGIRRSWLSLERADVILHVVDASQSKEDPELTQFEGTENKKRILVRNKIDLAPRLEQLPSLAAVDVSCLTGQGIESLKDAIKNLVWSGEIETGMMQVMINTRHQDALRRAQTAANDAREALQTEQSLELVALDLRTAMNAVGEIVGKTTTEDLLDMIFSQFCIGK